MLCARLLSAGLSYIFPRAMEAYGVHVVFAGSPGFFTPTRRSDGLACHSGCAQRVAQPCVERTRSRRKRHHSDERAFRAAVIQFSMQTCSIDA